MADITETLAPASAQLDNIDLRGTGPRVFTVIKVDVRPGAEQPVSVHFAEFDRPWKPGKNMRRVVAHYWGRESDNWVDKWIELYADEAVKFGNDTPGGTRISRMSHIEDVVDGAPIMLSKGKAGRYKVDPLPKIDCLRAEWRTAGPERREAIKAEIAALQPADVPAPDATAEDQS